MAQSRITHLRSAQLPGPAQCHLSPNISSDYAPKSVCSPPAHIDLEFFTAFNADFDALFGRAFNGQVVHLSDGSAYQADGFAVGEASQSLLVVVLGHSKFRVLFDEIASFHCNSARRLNRGQTRLDNAQPGAGTLTQRHGASNRNWALKSLVVELGPRSVVPAVRPAKSNVRVFSATNILHASDSLPNRIRPNRIRPNSQVHRHIVAAKPRLALCKPELDSR